MTLGPTVRTMRGESTGSPGSRSATLVSAQLRKQSSARPAEAAPLCAWPSASATATPRGGMAKMSPRSEEHTSELQSRGHLVCRLLLEKKKKNKTIQLHT